MDFVVVPILFFIAFWVFGIAAAVKQGKAKQKQSRMQSQNTYIAGQPRVYRPDPKDYVQVSKTSISTKAKGPSSLSDNKMFKDDRQNDWLARQMREEARIKRREMLDLGALHDANCAADLIRDEHRKVHNNKRGVL